MKESIIFCGRGEKKKDREKSYLAQNPRVIKRGTNNPNQQETVLDTSREEKIRSSRKIHTGIRSALPQKLVMTASRC